MTGGDAPAGSAKSTGSVKSAGSAKSAGSVKSTGSGGAELPWVEKYRPRTTKDLVGFKSVTDAILAYVRQKLADPTRELKPILLEGPPGIGKTSVVYAVARDLGLSVIEMNASDARTAKSIQQRLEETTQTRDLMSFLGKQRKRGKILLVDEVDGIHGQADRGGVATLKKIILDSKFPIILTANDYKQSLRSLYSVVEKKKCRRIRPRSMLKILKRIATREGIQAPERLLEQVANHANGDVRSAINDFEALIKTRKKLSLDTINDLYIERDVLESIFNAILDVFRAESVLEARRAVDASGERVEDFYMWLNENLPKYYRTPGELATGYEFLALADWFFSAVRTHQDYGLYPYVFDFAAGGAALARTETAAPVSYVRNQRPYIPRGRRGRADQELVHALKERWNLSTDQIASEILPRVKLLAKQSKAAKQHIAEELSLSSTAKRVL